MREQKNSHLGMIGWAMFLTGALSLGSCSGDDTIDTIQGEVISFGNVFVENSTRAIDPSYGKDKDIESFQVWGKVTGNTENTVNLYGGDGATVTKGTAAYGAAWACNETEYWIPSATYQFMAIANATSTSPEKGMPTTISYTADGETDLLLGELTTKGVKEVKTDVTASPTTGVNAEKVVDFTMSHLLSKVVFTFKNTDLETPLKVKEIKLTGTSTSGTYTIATGVWSENNDDYELGFGNEVTIPAGGEGTSEHERLVIPGTYTIGVAFKVNDEEGIGDEQVINTTLTDLQTFAPGHSYNITASIKSGMKEIIFNVTSAAWNGTNDEDVTVN